MTSPPDYVEVGWFCEGEENSRHFHRCYGWNLHNLDVSENVVIDFNTDITFEFKEYFEFVHTGHI